VSHTRVLDVFRTVGDTVLVGVVAVCADAVVLTCVPVGDEATEEAV
jgi:riboflavin biosynthesis pyrimidine reductase